MKVAVVVWGDAHEIGGEVDVGTFEHEPVTTYLCGWVIRDDEDGITICQEWWDRDDFENHARNVTFIPKGMIIEKRYLKLEKEPPKKKKKKTAKR